MRILFVSNTRIGDAVLSSGVLARLVEELPGARLTVACGAPAAPLFEAAPGLERTIVMEKGPLWAHWRALLAATAGTRWDTAVDMRGSATVWLLRARRRLAYRRRSDEIHRVEDMRRAFGLAAPPAPRVWLAERHRRAAGALLAGGEGPVLAIGPGANRAAKVWPAGRFAELAAALTGPDGPLPGARVAAAGGPDERAAAAAALAAIPAARRIDAMGAPLLDTAALLARCALYVGNDSGLMHLAAAAGAPTLGLFGPTRPENYAPWGARCAAIRAEPGPDGRARPMANLSVAAAARAATNLLARPGAGA